MINAVKNAMLVIAAFMVLAAGLWLRNAHVRDPMRNDESFTYLAYVRPGDYFNYSRPNNHVLNTLLTAAVVKYGGDSPAALRMPAFTCGYLLIPAIGLLCYQLCGCWFSAMAAMALAAASPIFVEYSVNGRGYTLLALAAVLMASLTVELRKSPGWKWGWVFWVLCGVAGLYAIPVMMYAIGPLVLLLLADRWPEARKRLGPMIVALVAMGILTALLYAPVVAKSGLASITANPFVAPMKIGAIPGEVAAAFKDTAAVWTGPGSELFVPFLCVGTLLCIVAVAWGGANILLLLPLAAIGVAVAGAFAQRHVPPPRVYIFLQAWMIACACAAIGSLARRKEWLRIGFAVMLGLLAVYDGYRVKKKPVLISEDPHTYIEAAHVAAELIRWGVCRGDTSMIWDFKENIWPPLLYYILRLHPDSAKAVAWNDPNSKVILILLYRADKVEDFLRGNPEFSQIYGEPRLVQMTANGGIYLARRR